MMKTMDKNSELENNHEGHSDRIEEIGKLTTSAVGLRRAADFIEQCLGEGNHELVHIILHEQDGRKIAGFIIPNTKDVLGGQVKLSGEK